MRDCAAEELGADRVGVSGGGGPARVDPDPVRRAVTALARCALRHGGLERVELAAEAPSLTLSPVTPASAPVLLGEDLRDLGAAVAVQVLRALGGDVRVEGETADDRSQLRDRLVTHALRVHDLGMDGAGLVAIMHVDVAGSTALATRRGDELAQRVLAETKLEVRERAEARGGRQIDAVGDAMMLTFESARSAIGAAEEIQEALAERERARPDETLRVRIGINVGEVLERDGHPFGAAVNAGARVMSKAGGGEILVSELARQLAGTVPGTTFRDRGRHDFKGFDEPWRLYQVEWPGSPPPPARVRRKPPRRRTLVAGVVVTAAVVVAVLVALLLARGGGTAADVPPDSLAEIDAAAGRVVAHLPGGQPADGGGRRQHEHRRPDGCRGPRGRVGRQPPETGRSRGWTRGRARGRPCGRPGHQGPVGRSRPGLGRGA